MPGPRIKAAQSPETFVEEGAAFVSLTGWGARARSTHHGSAPANEKRPSGGCASALSSHQKPGRADKPATSPSQSAAPGSAL